MKSFFTNIIRGLTIIHIASRYQIISYPDTKINYKIIKLALHIINFIFCPYKFLKPKDNIGKRLRLFLEKSGPIFIKFGQAISLRDDITGSLISQELKHLQDKLHEFEFDKAKKIIYENFNKNYYEIFKEFELKPVAAASIAQVYKAVTQDNKKVAVKILRPEIEKIYKRDISLLYFTISIVSNFILKLKRLKLKEIVKIFESTMHKELNLTIEAAASSEIKDQFKDSNNLYIPSIFWELTTKNILVTEWIEGISIYDKNKLIENNIDLKEVSKKISYIFFDQAYKNGYYHSDLHPGNVFVLKNGKICLIDFGITSRLNKKDRFAIAEILVGFLKRDYLKVAKIHIDAGYIPNNTDIYMFAQRCRIIGETIVGKPASEISLASLVKKLLEIVEDFSMNTQPQLFMLQKTLLMVEGIGKKLDPEINMWNIMEPWMTKWAHKNISPEAKFINKLFKLVNKFIDYIE